MVGVSPRSLESAARLKQQKTRLPKLGSGLKEPNGLEVWEPDADLALCGLWGVGAVDDIFANGQREVAADGAWGCLGHWVGAAGELTPCFDGAWALDDASNQWCGGDEGNQLAEEWLVGVLSVVLLSGFLVGDAQVHSNELEALAFDAGDDFANVAVCNTVWLDEDQSTFSHGVYFTCSTTSTAVFRSQ